MNNLELTPSGFAFWLIVLLLVLLAVVQLSGVYRQRHALPVPRFRWRAALHLLLWLSILGLVLRPKFHLPVNNRKAFLAGKDVSSATVRHLLDSLGNIKKLRVSDALPPGIDTLVLVGADFSDETLYHLAAYSNRPFVQWIPHRVANAFTDLNWDGLARSGALQEVYGQINTENGGLIRLMYAGETLDSVRVGQGACQFKLKFLVPTAGRNTATLLFNDESMDTLRFYGLASEPYTVRFVLESPDFEVNTLASWFGRQGNAAVYDVPVSTGIARSVKVNQVSDPSIFIVDSKGMDNAQMKKGFQSGKAVLIWGVTDPVAEVQKVNRSFGTTFKTKRISPKESVVIQPELTAQPFDFISGNRSIRVGKLPVEIQKGAGTVAVSLLNEAFPVQLSGDSTGYSVLWQSILAKLRPEPKRSISIAAPILTGIAADAEISGLPVNHRRMVVAKDTVSPGASALNSNVSQVPLMFRETGWQSVKIDSLDAEVYVEPGKASQARMSAFLDRYNGQILGGKSHDMPEPVPDWIWFVLITGILTALWIEPKL